MMHPTDTSRPKTHEFAKPPLNLLLNAPPAGTLSNRYQLIRGGHNAKLA